jgi:hypothetical protein
MEQNSENVKWDKKEKKMIKRSEEYADDKNYILHLKQCLSR